jgi:hypothetical protein
MAAAPAQKEPTILRVETAPPPTRRIERARVTRTAPQTVARPAAPPPPPAPVAAAPPPPPPPRATAPADITPRSGSEAPRRRAIDANNPYGDDK